MQNIPMLNNEQVGKLITVSECIDIIERLFKDLDHTQMPPKTYLNIPNGDFRAMPAALGDYACLKWIGVFPNNNEVDVTEMLRTKKITSVNYEASLKKLERLGKK